MYDKTTIHPNNIECIALQLWAHDSKSSDADKSINYQGDKVTNSKRFIVSLPNGLELPIQSRQILHNSREFAQKNYVKVLSDNNLFFGRWLDTEIGVICFDVNTSTDSYREAVIKARKYNQRAIFDNLAGEILPV